MALNGLTASEEAIERYGMADWREEAMGKPKLEMTGRVMESECKDQYTCIDYKRHRSMMAS